MVVSRADRRPIAQWWWTVDRGILACCLFLLVMGIFLSFAASPAVAVKIGRADSYAFVKQHILFSIPALCIMLGLSFLKPRAIRRFGAVLLTVSLALLALTLVYGLHIKGSVRWINFLGITLQPSEFMKPGLVIICAWLLSEKQKAPALPTFILAFLLYALCVVLLVLEPDIGQSFLISLLWGVLFVVAGGSFFIILFFACTLGAGGGLAYIFLHHVHERVNGFLTGEGDTFQVDRGREAILHGGWFGCGPGEGTIKRLIPDCHTDFVFSVAAEEYGILFCFLLVLAYLFIFVRSMQLALRERDFFKRFSIVGFATLINLQAMINIAVNLHLMPAKGMTLPFISYGGSSMLSVAICMGCLLALTRHKVQARVVLVGE